MMITWNEKEMFVRKGEPAPKPVSARKRHFSYLDGIALEAKERRLEEGGLSKYERLRLKAEVAEGRAYLAKHRKEIQEQSEAWQAQQSSEERAVETLGQSINGLTPSQAKNVLRKFSKSTSRPATEPARPKSVISSKK